MDKIRIKDEELAVKTRNVDHLGIVSGIVDEIGLVETIDALVGRHEQDVLSTGQTVKAMILNGLGFVSAPLYLYSRYFEHLDTELLLGKGVSWEHLNDDKLGHTLDKLQQVGTSKIFSQVALKACELLGVSREQKHLDGTSMSVYGEQYQKGYAGSLSEEARAEAAEPIKVVHGYSRDHRPDLRQFMIELMSAGDGDVPLWFAAQDGNTSEKKAFARRIKHYRKQFKEDGLYIVDSALFSQEKLKLLGSARWLTRVPLSLQQAKEAVQLAASAFRDCEATELKDYRLASLGSVTYAVEQRWLVVENKRSRQAAWRKLETKLTTQAQANQVKLGRLRRQVFHCEADALKAAKSLKTSLGFYTLSHISVQATAKYQTRGRPSASSPYVLQYQLCAELSQDETKLSQAKQQAGRFMLASNVLDEQALSDQAILLAYKEQQAAERGLAFLKDRIFFADNIFLKMPQRIEALAMVMGLCLLVYTLAQRQLRQNLQAEQATIPNQLAKPTSRPTLRWVFQMLQGIHSLLIDQRKLITNLTDELKHVLSFFSPSVRRYYLLL